MKKFLLAALVMIVATSFVNAQFTIVMPLAAGDTAVDTGTASKIIRNTDGTNGIVIHAILTKISGTVGGTLGVYGSGDGTNYDLIGSSVTPTNVASQQKTFVITGPLPEYLKVMETGTGTMSAKLTVKYRKPYFQPSR